jgi:hypothetical protein
MEYEDEDTEWIQEKYGYFVRATHELQEYITTGDIGLNEVNLFLYLNRRASPRFICFPPVEEIEAGTCLTPSQI